MPFQNFHSCEINKSITKIFGIKTVKTKYGMIRLVLGDKGNGKSAIRSMRIPASVPVSVAAGICNREKGTFRPATSGSSNNMMSEGVFYWDLECKEKQREVILSLIGDTEIKKPVQAIRDTWEFGKLPDDAFAFINIPSEKSSVVEKGPYGRFYPFKNTEGLIDREMIFWSLNELKKSDGVSAEDKLKALDKLITAAQVVGIAPDDNSTSETELSDFHFLFFLLASLD